MRNNWFLWVFLVVLLFFNCRNNTSLKSGKKNYSESSDSIESNIKIVKNNDIIQEKNIYKLDSLCQLSIESINDFFLKSKISALKYKVNGCYKINNSVIVSEENEQVNWKGAMILNEENEDIFFLESNWVNKEIISRITIYDNKILFKNRNHVGMKVIALRDDIDENSLFDSPDGYVLLKDIVDENIRYFINTGEIVVKSFEDIEDLTIDEIIILMGNNDTE